VGERDVTDGTPRPALGAFLFLSALWTGALLFFAGAAGIVLRTSPTRSDGGLVNRALLDVLDVSSLAATGLLLLLFFAADRRRPWGRVAHGAALRLLAIGAVAAFVSLYLVTPEMVSLRQKAGPAFEMLASTDPLRRAWGRLHGLSALTLVVRIAGAAATFFVGFSQTGKKPAPPAAASGGEPARTGSAVTGPEEPGGRTGSSASGIPRS
jgi:hypothetical protein